MSLSSKKHIRTKLAGVPKEPGVYLMKDASGTIIYVGKAKQLKNRLASYFNAGDKAHIRTEALVRNIADFEVMITETEVDAVLLERTLIKHHSPVFNVNLRDDKEYPYLRVDLNEDWPRFEKVRKRKDDKAFYLGPFSSAGQLKVMASLMQKVFPLIRCSRYEFANAKRPCNYYHMKLCLGPCKLPVERQQYLEMVQNGIAFLQGKNRQLVKVLKDSMKNAAEEERYELAALYRDQLQAFEKITERQSVIVENIPEADVVGLYQSGAKVSFCVQMVRDGKLIGQDNFIVKAPIQDDRGALGEFILQYYDSRSLPKEILLPLSLDEEGALAEALARSDTGSQPFKLYAPQKGPKRDLVLLAGKNAAYQLEESERLESKRQAEVEILKDKLGLAKSPQRMECIDISNLQGTAIVASNVCFLDGKPAKDQYRLYSIQTVEGGPDDYASIREVVRRRLDRGIREEDLPDLLVIDGGRGQLSAALEVLKEYPSLDVPIVGLAKSRVDKTNRKTKFIDASSPTRSFERVFFPERESPLALTPGSTEFRLLTHLRDEAHRFAISYHRKKRAKISRKSLLDDVPGVGKVLRNRLLAQFGNLNEMRRASIEELSKVQGMNRKTAELLYAHLQSLEIPTANQLPSS